MEEEGGWEQGGGWGKEGGGQHLGHAHISYSCLKPGNNVRANPTLMFFVS